MPALRDRVDRDALPALIWTASADGRCDSFNGAWQRFTGRSVGELVGDGWRASVHPEDLERCLGIRTASFEARSAYEMDLRLKRHDGHFRWMLDQGAPARGDGEPGTDGNAEHAGYVGVMVDIHDRKLLEESLADRARSLRLADRRQVEFLATLSHEMRNPLAPIANVASVLRTLEPANPLLVRLREILERQVGRLGKLVDEMVDATRVAQGQVSLVREATTVESIVQSAVARSHERISGGGHQLDVDIVDVGLAVRGDAARLAQALGNVIDNAARFSPEPGTISITVRRAAKTVHIAVADRGIGIAPDFLPQAFELFAQADRSLGRSGGGLGVGLSLARRVVQLHGGDVEVFSEGTGTGTEVIVWLPLLEVTDTEAEPITAARPMRENLRALIVEDHPDARESLRLQMELWGAEVTVAADGRQALEALARVKPQVVLCDLGLPGMDGLALARALRKKLDGGNCVLAAVTGYATHDDQQRALLAGFDAFLVKPLEPDSLSRLLRSAS